MNYRLQNKFFYRNLPPWDLCNNLQTSCLSTFHYNFELEITTKKLRSVYASSHTTCWKGLKFLLKGKLEISIGLVHKLSICIYFVLSFSVIKDSSLLGPWASDVQYEWKFLEWTLNKEMIKEKNQERPLEWQNVLNFATRMMNKRYKAGFPPLYPESFDLWPYDNQNMKFWNQYQTFQKVSMTWHVKRTSTWNIWKV